MNIFTGMMLLVVLAAFLMRGNIKGNKAFIVTAVILMFILMGLRDAETIGNDSRTSYRWEYNSMETTDWDELPAFFDFQNNPGLPRLMKVFRLVTHGDYQLFVIFLAAFILIAFGRFIYKYSVSPIQSMCYYWGLLFYLFMFSATKQAIAMTILLFAFDAIMEKKPGKFVLLVVSAAWFHFPAFIFLPAYWIARIKVDRWYLLLLALLFAVIYIFRTPIINLMMTAYGNENSNIDLEGVTFIGNKVLVMIVIIVAALLLRPLSNRNPLYSTLIRFLGIATLLQTFCYYNNIFERLADYYFQFSVIFIPLVFENTDEIKNSFSRQTNLLVKTGGAFLSCAFAIWRFSSVVATDEHFIPFKFFFR